MDSGMGKSDGAFEFEVLGELDAFVDELDGGADFTFDFVDLGLETSLEGRGIEFSFGRGLGFVDFHFLGEDVPFTGKLNGGGRIPREMDLAGLSESSSLMDDERVGSGIALGRDIGGFNGQGPSAVNGDSGEEPGFDGIHKFKTSRGRTASGCRRAGK